MKLYTLWIVMAVSLSATALTFAQSAETHAPADAAGILHSLPPDLHRKLQQLSELLDQHIKAGKITDAQIQQQLTSGRLEQTIRALSPEANRLFDEINVEMKNGKGPGEDALVPLLGGLSGPGK